MTACAALPTALIASALKHEDERRAEQAADEDRRLARGRRRCCWRAVSFVTSSR